MYKINITYPKERWEALKLRAREKVEYAAELAKAGAGKVEEKAEALRTRARLEREIVDLQEEIDLQMQDIGETMYAIHRGKPSGSSGYIQQVLEHLDDLYEQLDAHRQELDAALGVLVCPACGAVNETTYMYCCNCGHPLEK